jgi:hypothetical protein
VCDEGVSGGISTDQQSSQLITLVENGVASDRQLSFDKFRQCYSTCRCSVRLTTSEGAEESDTKLTSMSSLARPEFLDDDMTQSEAGFYVVWISDTVFLSSIHFDIFEHQVNLEYRITLTPKQSRDHIVFFVYSLSEDPPQPRPAPSVAPISFLESMVTVLPFDYFKALGFYWYRYDSEPPVKELLSLVPTPKPGIVPYEARTNLAFDSPLSPEQIQTVLSHCDENNLWVRPMFSLRAQNDAAFREYNSALRESPHLRHIHISSNYFRFQLPEGEAPFTVNEHLESMTIDCIPNIFRTSSNVNLLNAVSCCRNLKHLYMCVKRWQQFLDDNSSLLDLVISGSLPLEEVIISLDVGEYEIARFKVAWAVLSLTLLGCIVAGQRNLCHFSIVAGHREESWPVPSFLKAPVNPEAWDEFVTPSLTINCFRKLQMGIKGEETRIEAISVARKVQAVNLGIVYRKTTYHTPHDTSTANAGVLFVLLRSQFCAKTT